MDFTKLSKNRPEATIFLTVFVHNEEIVTAEVIPGISDHHIILMEINLEAWRKKILKRKVNIRDKADKDKVLEDLTNFQEPYFNTKGKPIQDRYDMIEEAIKTTMDKCIPSKLTSSRYTVPWFEREQRRMCRINNVNITKPKEPTIPNTGATTLRFPTSWKKNLKHARNTYINDNQSEAFKENSKRFWTFIKKIKHEDVGITDLKVNNSIVSDSKQKAEAFNQQFVSVFTAEEKTEVPDLGESRYPDITHI